MDPLSAISTALTSIKTAADIAKLLKDADLSLKNAELKLKVAEIVEALADAKLQMADIKQVMTEKDEVIARLQEALELKGKLILQDSAYWLPDEKGNVIGGPFCMGCFEANHVARTLVAGEKESQVKCPNCNSVFCSKPVYDRLRPDVEEGRKKYKIMLTHLGTQRRSVF